MAKYDSLGNYIYSNRFKTDSAAGYNSFASVFMRDDGTIYYSGTATSKINFATGNKKDYLEPTTNHGDIFIAQYQQTITLSQISNALTQSKNITSYKLNVYPNPISDKVNIQLNNIEQNNSTAIISLCDVSGKQIQTIETTFSNHNLNTTIKLPKNLSTGNYFVVANVQGKKYYSDILMK